MPLRYAVLIAAVLASACQGDSSDDGPLIDSASVGADAGGVCGDNTVDEGEECDGSDDCTAQCTMIRCGDGILSKGETCDDGNDVDGDACSASCELGPAAVIDIAVGA